MQLHIGYTGKQNMLYTLVDALQKAGFTVIINDDGTPSPEEVKDYTHSVPEDVIDQMPTYYKELLKHTKVMNLKVV